MPSASASAARAHRRCTGAVACIVALLAMVATDAARAAEMTDAAARRFFNTHHCNACHEAHEIRIGPSYQAVANAYPDTSPATVERLGMKIVHGGAGVWGVVPMISNPAVSMQEARQVAGWILGLRAGPEDR